MYLRQQMQVLQAQAGSMQEDAAVQTRSLQAANAELKAQRMKVGGFLSEPRALKQCCPLCTDPQNVTHSARNFAKKPEAAG